MGKLVGSRQRKLYRRWTRLAREYVATTDTYLATRTKEEAKAKALEDLKSPPPPSLSSNPYAANPRRPRRSQGGGDATPGLGLAPPAASSDFAASEYEQELIIKELMAKEAMEKRIANGGSDLPRQVVALETELNGR